MEKRGRGRPREFGKKAEKTAAKLRKKGVTFAGIAAEVGCSIGTARSLVARTEVDGEE